MNLMYQVPEEPEIDKITITREFILGNVDPIMVSGVNKKSA